MTLHEAIQTILIESRRSMSTTEIADILNSRLLYKKRDGSSITPFQIHGRTKNYPHLFSSNGSNVTLNSAGNEIQKKLVITADQRHSGPRNIPPDITHLENSLIKENSFKDAAGLEAIVPHTPGLYCIRVKDVNVLPPPFDNIAKDRGHNLLYIGIATRSLYRRLVDQELRANGHGSFFRSVGAMLGYRPLAGSLNSKKNKRNYSFTPADNLKIITWINQNLTVNWIETKDGYTTLEKALIHCHQPLLNLSQNSLALKELSILRAECVQVANKPF